MRSRWDLVGAWPVHARVVPARPGAPAVVLMHGLGVSGRYLMPTARRLAPDHLAIAPDLPGFGRSPRRAGAGDVEALAAVLARWIDAVGLERPAIVANSLGCQVAVALAADRPDRVRALVLVGPTVDRRARSLPRQALRLVADMPRERPSLVATAAAEWAWFIARGGWRLIRAALADPLERRLGDVPQPALVVRGEHDPLVPRRWAEEVAARLPGGRLREVPGAAHAVNHDAPEALAALVRAFLAEAPA